MLVVDKKLAVLSTWGHASPVWFQRWLLELQVLELTSLLETQRQENHRSATREFVSALGVWPRGVWLKMIGAMCFYKERAILIAEMKEYDDHQWLPWRFRLVIYCYRFPCHDMPWYILCYKPKWASSTEGLALAQDTIGVGSPATPRCVLAGCRHGM